MTEPVYAFEHPETDTLVRRVENERVVQILRAGRELARYPTHVNSPISCAPNGSVYFNPGRGALNHLVDLTYPFPQEPRPVPRGNLLHPNGEQVLAYHMARFPYEDPVTGQEHAGLLLVDLETGAAETLWHGETAHPRPVRLFDQPPSVLEEEHGWSSQNVDQELEFPHVFLAGDRATWALATDYRLEIGRNGERTASITWRQLQFFPVRVAFDLARERVLLSGKPGIVAFSLTGEVVAQWKGVLPCEPYKRRRRTVTEEEAPVVSPVTLWGDDLLAVVQVKEDRSAGYPYQTWYEVLRFDPQTLVLRGGLDGMPRRRDPDDNAALLPLADGSLAWVPRNQPLLVLPAPGAGRRSTRLVHVVGDELEPRVAHPDAGWYDRTIGSVGDLSPLDTTTAGQRKSLARFLLNELVGDGRFKQLVLLDRDAFRPYAEQVVAWDDDTLRLLREMDFRNFWRVARGASDAAVDALAVTIRAHLDELEQDRANVNHYRVQLLVGADTERALEHLADLARISPQVARHCRERHLEVPERGPAVRRFTPDFLEVNAYRVEEGELAHTPGLEFPLDAAAYLPEERGWTCHAPPAHILTARLDRLPGDPLAGSPLKFHHWFLSSGEECCDEGMVGHSLAYRVLPGSERRVSLVANLSYPGESRDEGECSYEPYDEAEAVETRYRLALEPFTARDLDWPNEKVGRLGGYPEWWQHAEVPDCPHCGRLMFYVGQVHASAIRDDVIDAALYGFHCEDCTIGAQVVQIT